jgi:gliding motility-associated-like protein
MKKNINRILTALIMWMFLSPYLHAQCGPVVSTFPYTEDFEASAAWTTGGTNNDWAWGTPANTTINNAGGGTKCWIAGGLTGNSYSNSEQAWIMSPCFDFSTLSYPWISFKIFWECERQWDGMVLQYSLNGGTTWANVGAFGDPVNCLNQNWFNYNNITWLNSLPAGTRNGWSGRTGPTVAACTGGFGSNTWVTATHCMTALANQPSVRFRFLFGSGTTCNSYDGIAIDDILIQNAPANNANFSSSCAGGNTVNFTNLSTQCPTAYAWDFGDPASGGANTSAATNPSHTFSGPGVYNVSLTTSGPCNAPSTIVIPVTILGANITSTPVTCNGAGDGTATAQPTAGAGPFNYVWNTLPVQNSPTATGLTPGTYTVTVTAAGACSVTSSVTITQPTPLNLTISSTTQPNCGASNGSITASASGGNGGYNYTWIPGPWPGNNYSGIGAGTYTCTVTDAQGCASTTSATLISLPPPTANANNTGPYCAGTTIQLNGSGSINYSWAGPLGFSSALQNPTLPLCTVGMGGVYTVTATDAFGCSGTATTTVIVNASPVPTATNTGPYCSGTNIQLNSPAGFATDDWAGPNGFVAADVQNPVIVGSTAAMTGIYTVTVTNGAGCSATATTSVVVNTSPVVIAGSNSPVCTGAQLDLNASLVAGVTYDWTGPNAFTALNQQNPSLPGVTIPASGLYTVLVTDGVGCTGTSTVNVLVNSNPVPIANNNGPLCEGNTLNLTSNGGIIFDWTGPNGFNQPNTQNPSITPITVADAGLYSVTVTDGNGCLATATTPVVVNVLPLASASNTGPVCEGNLLDLNANGGVLYAWTGPGGFVDPVNQNIQLNPAQVNQNGTYTVTVTDANGCSATATTHVVIYANPIINATTNAPVCTGNALILNANGANNYSWTGPSGFSAVLQNPTIVNPTVINNGLYTVTGTDLIGCSSTATVLVTVYASPTVALVASQLTGCAPVCIDFNDLSTVAGSTLQTWNWNVEGQNPSTNQNPTFCFNNPGQYDVSLTVSSADGCTATLGINDYIQINPTPVAEFIYAPNEIYESEPEVSFTNTSAGATSYIWNFGDGGSSVLTNPVYAFADTGMYCISLEAVNMAGCMDTVVHCLRVIPDFSIYVPNTFTPNKDELNPIFKIYGRGIASLEAIIFNRWGQEIYHFSDVESGWPGTLEDGTDCEMGVYIYKIRVTNVYGTEYNLTGQVNLLR